MAGPQSIDEQFSESYRNDPRTQQPSTGKVSKIRNVKTKGYDPDKRRGGISTRATGTLGEALEAQGSIMQATGDSKQAAGIRSVAAEHYQNAGQRVARTGRSLRLAAERVKGRKKLTATGVAGKVAARSVTLGIWSWGFFIWFWFQLPFTILSIVFMAITQVLHELYMSIQATADDNGMIKNAIGVLIDFTLKVISEFAKFFGFDFNDLNPANFFMMTHILVTVVGWGILLTIGIIYTVTGQKAFSGRGASGKNAMFLLAFIGYAIPILNLFPWFFLWTLMVLKNPK